MRVFLAGATGVIGRRVAESLLRQGHQVTGLTRNDSGVAALSSLGADVAVADVFDRDALAAAVEAAAPDVVVHQLTDLRGGDRSANSRIRQAGTRSLVDAARSAGVRRIVAQSIAFAYEPGGTPATEDVPLDVGSTGERHDSVTGVAVLESAVQELPEWVVLRYGMLYGPGTWYAPGGLMARAAIAGELPATADVTSFLHVDDAASAAVAALDWSSPGAVNICDDEPAPGHSWLPAFCERVGAPRPSTVDAPRTPWARGADNSRAREELGWEPKWPTWREGFAAL
ncbi:NAD(P)-dependent oxidoreductase [Lentzea sp.]|uniref:NAD-dependent epimerase/dehydratase family protein n=1 Tax=Lentzea sp. TaxID=56099 RepID=UPI002B9B283F|nr:NAD(P)-dependent oxidoreductase [Lentzea sp.]HUQ58845.1 NAD(P)-dependent oxidoreductase [Lentzea sp.]